MFNRSKTLTQFIGFVTMIVLALYGGVLLMDGDVFADGGKGPAVIVDSVPLIFNFQGNLTDAEGQPINGTYPMTFRLYGDNQASIDDASWTERQENVIVRDGHFSATLGAVNPLMSTVFAAGERFIGVQIDSEPEMLPRQRVGSVPFSVNADMLDGKDSSSFAWAKHKHSPADITDQLGDDKVADNLTITSGKISSSPITGSSITDSPIGQENPAPGTFTILQADQITSPRLTSVQSIDFQSGFKPFLFQNFRNLGDNVTHNTQISAEKYTCGISGFNSGTLDVNELGSGELIRIFMEKNTQTNTWFIKADVYSHHDGDDWSVWVMCINNSMVEQR